MPKTITSRPILILIGITIALMLLAAGFSNFELLPGEPFPFSIFLPQGQDGPRVNPPSFRLPSSFLEIFILLGLVFLILLLVLWIITFIIRPQARKRMLQRIITYFILLLLLNAALGFVQELNFANLDEAGRQVAQGQEEDGLPEESLPEPPGFIANPPRWLTVAISALLVGLILAVGWYLWRRRNALLARSAKREAGTLDLFVQEAEHTIDKIHHGDDLKHSVLNCYRAMTQLLSEDRGIQRDKAMTPRDFEHHLTNIGLTDDHIRRLTRLFEKVRYGGSNSTPAEEREAIDCLSAIVRVYGRSV